MEEERDFVQQPLRRAGVLDDDRLREAPEPLLLVARQRSAGVDDDGREGHVVLPGHRFEQLEAAQVRQVQIQDHAVEGRRLQLLERLAGVLHVRNLDVRAFEQLANALALPVVVFNDEHAPEALRELRFELLKRGDQLFPLDGFQGVPDRAALERLLRVVGDRQHVHGNVTRSGVVLELIEHPQPRVVREIDVQQDEDDGVLPFLLANREQGSLLALHLAEELTDPIHRGLPAVGTHDGHCALDVPRAPQRNRLTELPGFLNGELFERVDSLLLPGIVSGQASQALELAGERRLRVRVRVEIALFAGQEKATLARFRVLDAGKQRLQPVPHFEGLRHALDGRLAGLKRAVGEEGNERNRQDRDDESRERRRRQRTRSAAATGVRGSGRLGHGYRSSSEAPGWLDRLSGCFTL